MILHKEKRRAEARLRISGSLVLPDIVFQITQTRFVILDKRLCVFCVGTGQGRLTNGFISLYKPIHAASFFPLPYVTLRNSPQLTGNLV